MLAVTLALTQTGLVTLALALTQLSSPTSCIVTIQRIELKDARGDWTVVAEPDHPADVVNEAAGFSFFNNGRVPSGAYVNYRLTLLESVKVRTASGEEFRAWPGTPGKGIEITGAEDLDRPFAVTRGSFIGAWFELDLDGAVDTSGGKPIFNAPRTVRSVTVTVGEDTRTIGTDAIAVHY